MDDDAVVENNEQDGNESDKDDEADKSSSDEEVTSIHRYVEDLEKLLADPAKKKEINKIKKIYGEQLTPLELAVQGDSLEIVKLLVKNGAGATEERTGMIEFLLAAGADMNARDKDTRPHFAGLFWKERTRTPKPFCVTTDLTKRGADVNRRDYQNNTPLWLAAMNQHQVVATLLQKNCCDASIIFEAAKQNKEDVLETLLAYRHLKKMINNKDEKGLTALHIASKRGYLKIFTHDRTVVDDLDVEGKTAFHLAAENGRDKVLGVLKLKDERLLIKHGHPAVIQLLLDKGAKILPDKTGLNYFDHAIDNGHI
nr:hypothetical protein BaRGS_000650 [Batillaria attramentaria]